VANVVEIVIKAFDEASGVFSKVGGNFNKIASSAAGAAHKISEAGEHLRKSGKDMIVAGAEFAAPGLAGLYAIKKLVDAGAEYSGALAHVKTAMSDGALTQAHLNELQEVSEKTALHGVISTKDLAGAYYIARSNALAGTSAEQAHKDALDAMVAATNLVTVSTSNAEEAQAALGDTTRTLTGLHNIYHISVDSLADSLALLQTKYAFKNITEITDALKFVAPVAKNAGLSMAETAADVAVLSQNMQIGGQAGTELRNVIIEFEKGGTKGRLRPFQKLNAEGKLDLAASLKAYQEYLSKLSPSAANASMIAAGFSARSLVAMQTLLANINTTASIRTDWSNSFGAAAEGAKTRLAGADEQIEILKNSLSVLMETVGTALLPTAITGVKSLTASIGELVTWTTAHTPEISSAMKSVGDAIGSLAGMLKTVIGYFVQFGDAHPAIAQLGLKLGLLLPVLSIMGGTLITLAGAFTILSGVILGPIGLIALFAAAAYEVYDRWSAVPTFFADIWGGVKRIFSGALTWFKSMGFGMMRSLGEGILAGLEWPFKAAEHVAEKIGGFFHFHSPPEYGPLRDAVLNFRLGEELATHTKAAPAVHAASQMAMQMAVHLTDDTLRARYGFAEKGESTISQAVRTLQLMPVPSIPHAVPTLQPTLAPVLAPGTSSTANSTINHGAITIHVNYRPTFGGVTPETLDPRRHADEIVRIIEDSLRRRHRLELR